MTKEYSDLLDILHYTRRSEADSRFIWCVAADAFETTIFQRRGLILGGAWSPHFLRDRSAFGWGVPWTVHLRAPTILGIERSVAPISEWIPLMEEIAQAGESLLLVTREVSTELLHTFIVNSLKETLACCVVRADEGMPGWKQPSASALWAYEGPPSRSAGLLPKAAEAWIRRTATVVFPSPDSGWWPETNDITVIAVGGKNHDDQHDRLRFLVETIQDQQMGRHG